MYKEAKEVMLITLFTKIKKIYQIFLSAHVHYEP